MQMLVSYRVCTLFLGPMVKHSLLESGMLAGLAQHQIAIITRLWWNHDSKFKDSIYSVFREVQSKLLEFRNLTFLPCLLTKYLAPMKVQAHSRYLNICYGNEWTSLAQIGSKEIRILYPLLSQCFTVNKLYPIFSFPKQKGCHLFSRLFKLLIR